MTVSTALLHRCAADGRSVVFLDFAGRFQARVEGPTSGNVLLRRAQHEALTDATGCSPSAGPSWLAKFQNSRQVLLRGAREAANPEDAGFAGRRGPAHRGHLAARGDGTGPGHRARAGRGRSPTIFRGVRPIGARGAGRVRHERPVRAARRWIG